MQFHFDSTGDITAVDTAARPGQVDGREVNAGWGGRFSDYAWVGGIRIPTRGEVYWDLPDGRFVYWRGQVTAVELRSELLRPSRRSIVGIPHRTSKTRSSSRCCSQTATRGGVTTPRH